MEMYDMMKPPMDAKQESFSKETGGHAEMMAQVLMGLGRLEAKIDMMMAEDKSEDAKEKEYDSGPELATNPAIHSTQLEFDLPPIF